MKILKSLFILFSTLFLATLVSSSYFSDNKSISGNKAATGNWPTSQKLVINEVYYPGEGQGYSLSALNVKGNTGWFELYNPTFQTVSLNGWTLQTKDRWADDHWEICQKPLVEPGKNVIIPPQRFAIVTPDKPSFFDYWMGEIGGLSQSPIYIVSPDIFGCSDNPLSSAGGKLILRDEKGTIIDQISWGSDDSVLNPAISNVTEGRSTERNPTGKDTDTNSDFVEKAKPTPGK